MRGSVCPMAIRYSSRHHLRGCNLQHVYLYRLRPSNVHEVKSNRRWRLCLSITVRLPSPFPNYRNLVCSARELTH